MEGISTDMLKGKVAWITASSRGIGRAIAKRLACCGASVVVHSRTDRTAAEFGEAPSTNYVAEEMKEAGVPVITVFADLSDLSQVRVAKERIEKTLGPIDILVNNAGGDIGSGGRPDPNDALFISEDDINAVIARNLLSTIHCCQAVVPGMIKRKKGRIINIVSTDAYLGQAEGSIYASAKAGQAHYTRCLAAQLREYGITANMVAPGGTLTGRFIATGQADPSLVDAMETVTLKRYARPDEIACAVQFFVSPLADFVSGQVLRVDGASQLSPA
jgi:NAD(P)-dependent dehydrogenase (short-subunit alcohol dehydrogenase family)